MESLRGQLLIAGAGLLDPNFRRTVVLVGQHTEEGAVGVVLNRPAPQTVREVAPDLAELVGHDEPIFLGGPVQPQGAVVVAQFAHPDLADVLVFDSVGFVTHELEPELRAAVRRARVFAGHAGWGPGQLESELEQDAWILEPARPEDVFTPAPERLWSTVLRRKGEAYRLLSLMPYDPSMN
jgi:putative transcriptional regulator